MSDLIIKKNGTDYKLPMLAEHYPADRVYLGGDINKTVEDALNYSTDEHVVGKWIDGSILYEKTVSFSPLPNNTYAGYSLGIPTGAVVRTCEAFAMTGDYLQPLETYSGGNYTHWYTERQTITVLTNGDMSAWTGRATVRYTKA